MIVHAWLAILPNTFIFNQSRKCKPLFAAERCMCMCGEKTRVRCSIGKGAAPPELRSDDQMGVCIERF